MNDTTRPLHQCETVSGYSLDSLVRCTNPGVVLYGDTSDSAHWVCEEHEAVFAAGSGVDDTADGVDFPAVARSSSAAKAETSEQSPSDPGRPGPLIDYAPIGWLTTSQGITQAWGCSLCGAAVTIASGHNGLRLHEKWHAVNDAAVEGVMLLLEQKR